MKIVALVSNCKDCPNRVYYSGGRYNCAKAGTALPYETYSIPAWCPLADYPAAAMTRLQDENAALRRQIASSESRP